MVEKATKRYIVVMPIYNNAGTLTDVVERVLRIGLPLLVVNDGSTDGTAELLAQWEGITVLTHERNRGKGAALKWALQWANEQGYDYAISIDSDGQHYPEDIPKLIEASRANEGALIVGARNLTADNMPGKNSFGNRFSNFWFRIETGQKMEDTQSGFRVYPVHEVVRLKLFTGKYEFEYEVLVQAVWHGIRVLNIPVQVYYPPEGERVSHFKPWRDFTRISLLNSVLVLVALFWYYPKKALRWCTKENIRQFIRRNITHSPESNGRITLAVMLGVFMGCAPIWGYQMIVALFLAQLLKLNKVITLVAANISIPPVIPFILFGSYAAGAWVLGRELTFTIDDMSLDFVWQSLWQYVLGALVFGALLALVLGAVCFVLLHLFRKPYQEVQEVIDEEL